MNSKFRQILAVVKLIPAGKVATYGQIADLAGLPRRARLVSTALKANDCPLVPWHRVVNSQGKISIPAADAGHQLQLSLLRSDGVMASGSRVDLKAYLWQPSLDTLLFELNF